MTEIADNAGFGKQSGPLALYLLIGQSNMAGRGKLDGRSQPHPRAWMFTRDQCWAPAADPIHFDKPEAGVGPGLTFASTMADAAPSSDAPIGLVPCAVGGTPLDRWSRGGDLYEMALRRCRAAMTGDDRPKVLRGILWHQGEWDAMEMDTSETYGQRLAAMIASLRADLETADCPIVVGQIGEFLDGQEKFPGTRLINAALQALPEQVERCACVSAAGLAHGGDQLHFSADAARELGRRYAAAMLGLQR